MDSVPTSYKRLVLRSLRQEAKKRAITIYEVLLEYGSAQVKATKGGITLVTSNTNGQASGFLPNAGEGLTPLLYAEMLSDLLDRHDDSKAALIEAGTASPTDDQVVARMLEFLQPITETLADFSCRIFST